MEETHYKARCFGPIVLGYEMYRIPQNLLHFVNVLLEIKVPDDGSVLQEQSHKC